MSTRPVWMEKPSPVVATGKAVILAVCCLVVLIPFIAVISTSLASQHEVTSAGGYVLIVHHPTTAAYRALFAGGVVTRALAVSLIITFVGTLLSLAATAGLAYSLSRPGSLGSRPVLFIVLGTLLFSPGLIPTFLTVKELGLLDNYWSLILPVLISGFFVVVMRAFFMELPQEVFESARIDGAGEFTILRRIVLPLSRAVFAVIGLFYAVGYWTAFFGALLYLNDPTKWPISLVLRTYVVNQVPLGNEQLNVGNTILPPQQSLQMAVLVVSLIPVLIVYPFLQRHFTKGVLIGAVKG